MRSAEERAQGDRERHHWVVVGSRDGAAHVGHRHHDGTDRQRGKGGSDAHAHRRAEREAPHHGAKDLDDHGRELLHDGWTLSGELCPSCDVEEEAHDNAANDGPQEPNPNLLLRARAIEDRHEAHGRVEGPAAEAPHRDEEKKAVKPMDKP